MAQDQEREKTEPPTPKRRKEARERGNVVRSAEVNSAAVLWSALLSFFFAGSWMYVKLTDSMRWILAHQLNDPLDIQSAWILMYKMTGASFMILAPVLLSIAVAGIASNLIQFGFVFSVTPLVPNFSKLNPINGLRRIFSLRGLFELIKSLVKILLIGMLVYILLKSEAEKLPGLMQMEVYDMLVYISRAGLKIGFFVCLALTMLALLDFTYQQWRHEKDLRMTLQELKDETRDTEGDPRIKARVRSIQLEIRRRRMMTAVPEADAIITNPTRLAIAIQYDPSTMSAPVVTAKGAGFIADKIRALAQQHNVPLVENRLLATALYKTVNIGATVPVDLYHAVAQVLAYIYRLKGVNV